ncbi:MAG: CRISPR-associated protein Cas4 [Gammaproteobacteria bacterium]
MDDPIPISALQHFVFCPRQCAYIHIERIWQDNYLTAQGNLLHERVHGNEAESRGNLRTERGVQVFSDRLGIFGQLDLLEIKSTPYTLTPVEYKRGKPKVDDCDRVQLCAQVLCLEEMRGLAIDRAALWYWQFRKREWVPVDEALREKTLQIIKATRDLLESGKLPKARYTKACKACSLFDECAPKQSDHSRAYLDQLFLP